MVGVGNAKGEVTIFQIPKELPNDLVSDQIAASLVTQKSIERYTIKDVDRAAITCVEWSKNGMKLFSGDANGVVILTEFDFNEHISKSIEILNEKYEIVQLNFSKPWLLVSTLFRSIVCRQTNENQWIISQIGRTDRKVLNNFGAVFTTTDVNDPKKQPSIICSRPGFRFWMADIDGNVSHTFLLKASVNEIRSISEVPLLNPVHNKVTNIQGTHFGPCYFYMKKFIVTYCDAMIFIVNLEKLKVMATIKRLRKIQYLAINGNEIFILEGGHSIVRLSTEPTTANPIHSETVRIENDVLHQETNGNSENSVAQADECFELPPIEYIELDVPLACRLTEHNLLKEDKLLLEHSRKLEVFEKINTLDYDDSILFDTGTKKKRKNFPDTNEKEMINGIVEIGRQAEFMDQNIDRENIPVKFSNLKLNGPHTSDIKQRLKELNYNIEYKMNKNSIASHGQTTKEANLNGDSKMDFIPKVNGKSSPYKPLEFNYPAYPVVDMNDGLRQNNIEPSTTKKNDIEIKKEQKTLKTASTLDLEKIKEFPSLANIPKLWDIKIEQYDEMVNGDNDRPNSNSNKISTNEGSDSEWVLL